MKPSERILELYEGCYDSLLKVMWEGLQKAPDPPQTIAELRTFLDDPKHERAALKNVMVAQAHVMGVALTLDEEHERRAAFEKRVALTLDEEHERRAAFEKRVLARVAELERAAGILGP